MNWAFLDEPGPIWQEPDTATAASPGLRVDCHSSNAVAEQQAPDARSDESSDLGSRSVLPPRPATQPLQVDSAWRNVTLDQLVTSKRTVEASVAAGVAASFRRRKASLQAAEAQRSACTAADSVQDCVALMLEDFRLMDHQARCAYQPPSPPPSPPPLTPPPLTPPTSCTPHSSPHPQLHPFILTVMDHQSTWRLAVAPLLPDALAAAGGVSACDGTRSRSPGKPHSSGPRPRSAAPGRTPAGPADASGRDGGGGGGGGGGGRWGEVAALLLKQLEVGEPEHVAHRSTLLLRSDKQPDSLMVVTSSVGAVGAVQRLKPNSLWHASSTHPLAQDAFAVLRSGDARLRLYLLVTYSPTILTYVHIAYTSLSCHTYSPIYFLRRRAAPLSARHRGRDLGGATRWP
jgi:hypothetical protein